MFEFLARFNPLNKTPASIRIAEMEKKIEEKEKINGVLDKTIVERSTFVMENAKKIEDTANEMMENFDKYRGV